MILSDFWPSARSIAGKAGLLLCIAISLWAGPACAQDTALPPATAMPAAIDALMAKYTCKACHRVDTRLIGPSFREISTTKGYTPAQIVALIYKPVPSHWPDYPAMAAVSFIPKADAMKIARWIAALSGPKPAPKPVGRGHTKRSVKA